MGSTTDASTRDLLPCNTKETGSVRAWKWSASIHQLQGVVMVRCGYFDSRVLFSPRSKNRAGKMRWRGRPVCSSEQCSLWGSGPPKRLKVYRIVNKESDIGTSDA